MYITITPQKLGDNYTQSAGDFVAYLEKENDGLKMVYSKLLMELKKIK